MGLDIYFGNLEPYLRSAYGSTDRPKTMARHALEIVRAQIEKQTGDPPDLRENQVPAELGPVRYGSYSSIHVLRLYACRLAGYTLDEAYALPEIRAGLLPPRDEEDEEEESLYGQTSSSSSEEVSDEREIEQAFDFVLNDVLPLAATKADPFPYQNLVCFSDTEGIYIPARFRSPIVVDDIYVGSSTGLAAELDEVGKRLAMQLQSGSGGNVQEFLELVRQLWTTLDEPCQQSVRGQFSMIFG